MRMRGLWNSLSDMLSARSFDAVNNECYFRPAFDGSRYSFGIDHHALITPAQDRYHVAASAAGQDLGENLLISPAETSPSDCLTIVHNRLDTES